MMIYKIKGVLFALVVGIFLQGSSFALNLELTQGVNQSIPIAVMAFSSPAIQIPGKATLADVVTNDLTYSGRFQVQRLASLGLNAQLSTQNYNSWRKLGVNDVVYGTIEPDANGSYNVSAQLVDVYTRAVLWHGFYHTNQVGLRHIAHVISDQIYSQLTGIAGIFSTKIAYVLVQGKPPARRLYSLEVADADGFNPQSLVVSPMPIMSPTWSPDGRKIAYVSFEHERASVYLQDVSSGARSKISALPGINGAPAFSPDGRSIALVRSVSGAAKIYELSLVSGQVQQLTRGYATDTEPNFSPDGTRLLFTSTRGGGVQIYQDQLSSGQITRLTFSGNYNATGRYMPNGKGFVMLHRDHGIFSIAKQPLQSFAKVTVLDQSDSDESPSIAPNGQMVLYSTRYQGRRVLAMVSIDGRIKLRLPSRDGNVQEPAWSPFFSKGPGNQRRSL